MTTKPQVLVTGGGTFLGDSIAAALLAEGVEVTLLVRPGAEEKIGLLAQRVRSYTADVWNPGSLKGRARGHDSVIHTVGSLSADPAQGLTFQWLNFVSARNVANMCVSSGVPHMVLLSSARAPWVSGQYIAAKREAEAYMPRVGLRATVIRAPIAYVRGTQRRPFYALMSLLGAIPPLSWLWFGQVAPMPVDVLARGVARITLEQRQKDAVFSARDLRKHNSSRERRSGVSEREAQIQQQPPSYPVDDNSPFGWLPPDEDK
ncbi:MAG: NAD(P)H-binding protein [Chloroflexi bacterium]|nr:NAD(P)H-binding protein [Chloroflexota bacterium]